MERALGLDIGDRTIGIAVSDLLGMTAQGVETIPELLWRKIYSDCRS